MPRGAEARADLPGEPGGEGPESRAGLRGGRLRWAPLLPGLVVLVGVVTLVVRQGEARRFAALLAGVRPGWLLAAAALQAATYACAALVWRAVLRRAGRPLPLRSLYPLGLAKLFADQALPSAGASGMVLVVLGLGRRGIPRGIAVAAMLVSLLAFYGAYGISVAASLGILWSHGGLAPGVLVLCAGFVGLASLVPTTILILTHPGRGPAPAWTRRVPGLSPLLGAFAEAPAALVRDAGVLLPAILFQLSIFVLDAATLAVMLAAIGVAPEAGTVFATFVLASLAGTLGGIPGGLGTFEGASVAVLGWLGVPWEAALTGTLLLRGFTFWLPMLPGLILARREVAASASPASDQGSGQGVPRTIRSSSSPRRSLPK